MSDAQRKDTPEQAEFRAYCQEWLANNHPGRPPVRLPQGALELSDPDALAWLQAWQKSAYDAGLIGCDYPKEVGGGGMTDWGCHGFGGAMLTRLLSRHADSDVVDDLQAQLANARAEFEELLRDRQDGILNEWAHRAAVELLFVRLRERI